MGASPAGADTFSNIAQCESGGNYSTNTGNGFYGAYQFTQATWNSLGYSGSPAGASPATQDAAAHQLAARSGFGQWPVCGAGAGSASAAAPAPSYSAPQQASRSYTRTPVQQAPVQQAPVQQLAVQAAPAASPFLTTALVNQVRPDVRQLQQSLANLHYNLAIDGQYGPQTKTVVEHFQHDSGIQVDGIVGPQTQNAIR